MLDLRCEFTLLYRTFVIGMTAASECHAISSETRRKIVSFVLCERPRGSIRHTLKIGTLTVESVRGKTECKREQSTERARKDACKFGDAFDGRSFCSLCVAAARLRARVPSSAPVCPLFVFGLADHNLD